MPCKYLRVRAKDVGKPGRHYLKLGVTKKKGKKGGRTKAIGGLRLYKKKRK